MIRAQPDLPPIQPGLHPAVKRGWVEDGPYADKSAAAFSEPRDPNDSDFTWAINNAGMRHFVLNIGMRELISVTGLLPTQTTYIANSL